MSVNRHGGSAGDGKFPRKVSAVLPRTPCTLLNNGIPPYFIIKENSLNFHEHYNDAIELCVMIIPFLLYARLFCYAQEISSARILDCRQESREESARLTPRSRPQIQGHRPGDRSQRGVCITTTVRSAKTRRCVPTEETYTGFQKAYEFLNGKLFDG
jgi:hypothetical protein